MKSNKINIKIFAEYILSRPKLSHHFEFDKYVFDAFIVECFPDTWFYDKTKGYRANVKPEVSQLFSSNKNLYKCLLWWFGVSELHFKQLFRHGKPYTMCEKRQTLIEIEKGWSSVELSCTMNSHEFAEELLKYYNWYQTLNDLNSE